MDKRLSIGMLAGIAAFACSLPALAGVKDGVDAWNRGDWDAAVAAWREPAQAGDPDALFNMGQAYRLGRGVAQDQRTAEAYYLRAAQAGHLRAADTYGLLLFQDGRREAALPFVRGAAERGDPRAQYLLGVAHFNGDIVTKDWVRAYALLILANGQGLPQAAPALAEMDRHIPLAQRQQAASLAVQMQQQADATRAREMASAELALAVPGQASGQPATPATPVSPSAPAGLQPAPVQPAASRLPQPVATIPVAPSSAGVPPPSSAEREPAAAEARRAVQAAMTASGTEDPGEAGADFARSASATAQARSALPEPERPAAAQPSPAQAAPAGSWKLQLGAFSVRANAERLATSLRDRPELAGKAAALVQSGRLTRLLFGSYATRAEAETACASLERAGQACIVTR